MSKFILIIFFILINILFAQNNELIIFHAGSFSKPLDSLIKEFKKENPKINIKKEIAGSIECARKISELNKACDIFISSDYKVIDDLLIPNYAEINIKFATNEIVIAFSENSIGANKINSNNWFKILLDSTIKIGRSEPNNDPCGYRTVITLRLAEKFYGIKLLSKKILGKNPELIRPKEVDLLSLLEIGEADYIFTYRSVALQHKLKFISLRDEINLGNLFFNNFYNNETVTIKGKTIDKKIILKGEAIVYGITFPKNTLNPNEAIKFVDFLLSDKGKNIIQKFGLKFKNPISCNNYNLLPKELKKYMNVKND